MRRVSWTQSRGCGWAGAGGLLGLTALALLLTLSAVGRGPVAGAGSSAPVVTVLPRPTATVMVVVPATPTPTETAVPPPPSDPGSLGIGGLAEVHGTEGDGLRLRGEPSTAAPIEFLAGESEVFIIEDGPRSADGRTWFYLVSPSDARRAGWAVADYLRPAQ